MERFNQRGLSEEKRKEALKTEIIDIENEILYNALRYEKTQGIFSVKSCYFLYLDVDKLNKSIYNT